MQYGVYVDFFDSLMFRSDIVCRMCILITETQHGFAYTLNGSSSKTFPNRHEARTEAIKKANEIYNNNQKSNK